MKVFLDDIREPEHCIHYMPRRIGPASAIYLEDWVVVRNYDEFKEVVSKNIRRITHVSFDHDLADSHYTPEEFWEDYYKSDEWQKAQVHSEKTGYECAKWMKEFYEDSGVGLPTLFVHSMNPVGTDKIINLFKDEKKT
jgi:hypothetical protein